MKTLVTVLAGAVLAGAALGSDPQPGRALPDLHLRLESTYTDAAGARAQIAAASAAPVVTMATYVVKQSRLRSGPQPEIPRGAPGPTGNRFVDALQSGILRQHVGSKFTTELLAHGEPDPGGFAHLTFSYRISW